MNSSSKRNTIYPLLTFVLIILIWQIVVGCSENLQLILPTPTRIILVAIVDFRLLAKASFITIAEALAGLFLANVLGIIVAVLLYIDRRLSLCFQPLLIISQTVPLIAIVPILIIIFGFGWGTKIAVVTIYGMFPIAISTLHGLKNTPQNLIDLAHTWQCSRAWIIRHVCWQHAKSDYFSGLRIAGTYSLGTAAMAEYFGAKNGLGIYILTAHTNFKTAYVFVGAMVLVIYTLCIYAIIGIFERSLIPYRHRKTEEH